MPSGSRSVSVGLISDTHGLLRPQALAALRGCRLIVHAGDIGAPQVLEALARIAPVTAVRGNNDNGPWANDLRDTEVLDIAQKRVGVIHNLSELDGPGDWQVVVSGHSHRPASEIRDGVLYVNPGSAGPRRFKLPVTVARLALPARRVVFKTLV
jgi:putative phosphoesterase